MTKPPCFDLGEFASWSEANALCQPRYRASSPCDDCIWAFAIEQRALGLCTGRPPGPEIPRDGAHSGALRVDDLSRAYPTAPQETPS
jgi:hypothetical protein